MPFIPNTPESYLSRSDSKDPSTTCRGITSNGVPCRRSLATPSPSPSPSPSAKKTSNGRTSKPFLTPDDDPENSYCWQHKDQASISPQSTPLKGTGLDKRSSIDTLADRLGLMGVDSKMERKMRERREREGKKRKDRDAEKAGRYHEKRKERKTLRCCFCFDIPIEEVEPPSRPHPRPVQPTTKASVPSTPQQNGRKYAGPNTQAHSAPPRLNLPPKDVSTPTPSPRKSQQPKEPGKLSDTAQYFSLIPPSTDPQTASALMAELAKGYVDSEEPGYIYMFWMMPPSKKDPPVDAARGLLSDDAPTRGRRVSDVVSSYSGNSGTASGKKDKTMLLKIGRAANVQRRMNQWSRQCGYEVEVLRFYPYIPGSERDTTANITGVNTARMTPHVKKVERLIHIELAGRGLRADLGTCEACGKEHREWFQVGARRGDVRSVDEVIRRWTGWDEGVSKS